LPNVEYKRSKKRDAVGSRLPVGRKRTKEFKDGETMPITFRLDARLAKQLDTEAERLSEEMGFPVTRVDIIRQWLKESAARRGKR
jgi:hypothetical protein